MNIALVEYGAGNLPSVERALTRLGVESCRASTLEGLASCDALILPGVGHFGALMRSLTERSLVKPLRDAVASGVPLLGICLGLQAMFAKSDEAIGDAGLGLFPQKVSALPPTGRLPHMGWNQLRRVRPSALLEGVPQDAYFILRIRMRRSMREKRPSRCATTAPPSSPCSSKETFSRRSFIRRSRGLPARKCFQTSCGAQARNNEPRAPHHSLPGH